MLCGCEDVCADQVFCVVELIALNQEGRYAGFPALKRATLHLLDIDAQSIEHFEGWHQGAHSVLIPDCDLLQVPVWCCLVRELNRRHSKFGDKIG